MAESNVHQLLSTEELAERWLRNYDDKFLACRMSHDWPRIVPGRRLTRTLIQAVPPEEGMPTGVCLVEQRCGNCGRLRWKLTGPRGDWYDPDQRWRYVDPKKYSQPHGYGLTKADFAREFWRRVMEDWEASEARVQAEVRKAQGNGA